MLNTKTYIQANMPAIIMNLIKGNLWHGKSINAMIENDVDDTRQYHFVDINEFENAIRQTWAEIKADKNKLKSLIKRDMKTYISPSYKTVNAFVICEIENPAITNIDRLWDAIQKM